MSTNKKPASGCSHEAGLSTVFLRLPAHLSAIVARMKVLAVGLICALPAMVGGAILLASLAALLEALT